jgi:hypothetical protein
MIRELIALCAVGAVGVALVGCNKDEAPVDPYLEATLREAVYGEVASPDFRYKIVKPEIVDGLGEFVVMRQSKQTEFLVGNGIAAKIDSLPDKSNLTFNVVKQFQPMVHFLCIDILTPTDSISVSSDKPVAFPRTADAAGYDPPEDYVRTEMTAFRWNDTEGLRKMIDTKHAIHAALRHVDEDSISYWVLEGADSSRTVWGQIPKLRVRKPRPSLEIVLRMLARTDQDFVGGITYADIEPWDFRRKNYICGTVDIGYVRFLDRVFSR